MSLPTSIYYVISGLVGQVLNLEVHAFGNSDEKTV